jgi:transketolase
MSPNSLRLKIVELVYKSKEGHIPSAFSIVDIIYYIYRKRIKKNNSKFILSKGHGALALYVVLNYFKILKTKILNLYYKNNSLIGGHPEISLDGVEASTGSLGHGFSTATGIAIALKIKKNFKKKIYVLVGDGECNEGPIWESAHIAANYDLDNLICIVDNNKSSKNLLPLDNLYKKWIAFGWYVLKANGHSVKSMDNAFKKIDKKKNKKPSVIIANTIKGKGVYFMENNGKWHHKVPNKNELDKINKILN